MLGSIQDVIKVAQFIYQQAALARANKQQCQRVAERVKIIISAVEGLDKHPNPNQFKDGLNTLQECLNECLNFIEQFSASNNWFKAVLKAGAHENQFSSFNKKFAEIMTVLNLGIDTQMFLTNAEDTKALKEDLQYIQDKQQEIIDLQIQANRGIEGILLKQEEQYQLLQAQMMSMRNQLAQFSKISQRPDVDPNLLINFFDIIFQEKVSTNGAEELYLAQWQGHTVNVKRLQTLSQANRIELIREVQILSRLRHPNIVSMYGVSLQVGTESIVMECLKQGSLSKRLQQGALSIELQQCIALGIANGLAYLHAHQNHILHQDLTSENIFINENNQVKLAGFGLAYAHTQSVAKPENLSKLLNNMAPEVVQGKPYTAKSDVYSFGIILSEISGAHLLNYDAIIRGCCAKNPDDRPQMKEVVTQLNSHTLKMAQVHHQTMTSPNNNYTSMTSLAAFPTQKSIEEQEILLLFSKAKISEKSEQHQDAFKLYLSAAEKGDIKSMANVGLYLLEGIGGIKSNKLSAYEWLLKAANKGEPRAQYNLARMLEKGDGVVENKYEARSWYQQAANQNQDDKTAQRAKAKLEQIFVHKNVI